jgi:phage baseplate assembly protein W|tara:strand:- start:1928 stop:2329 length:402 start_codon:yes stop_codon:yes gene_type:complete
MASQRVSRAFKDISFSFDPHPVSKDLPIITNERAIIRSVRNLVETIPTERFFNPTLGTDIRQSLFELVSYNTATIIKDQIVNTVGFYEDRIENLKVKVDPQPDDNSFDVTIFFDIVGQDFPPQSFSFILEATR